MERKWLDSNASGLIFDEDFNFGGSPLIRESNRNTFIPQLAQPGWNCCTSSLEFEAVFS